LLAAQSLDIDIKKKLTHEISVNIDIESDYNIGLIIGSSGSGKTTLAKKIFGEDALDIDFDPEKTVLDQLPQDLSYDECAEILSGIGLTSVPTWLRPMKTLSNGQLARAIAALAMVKKEITVIDEWTSVVDRTVAKIMSHCIKKFSKKKNKKIVLISCHYDVIEWLDPDWIIDCNTQTFHDRRLLHSDERIRKEKLEFQIREVDRRTWKYFSKYHYLSENLPGGKIYTFGLFDKKNQIGFQCFANYIPTLRNKVPIYHFNRTVIHPDYAGLGLGIHLITETSKFMKKNYGYKIMGTFSSVPVYKSMIKHPQWKLIEIKRKQGKTKVGEKMLRKNGFRENIKTYSFLFVG
jgi:ABC-type Mn2+/Zn2+ transport system ATPase subunit/GNAT superfamily N-acetyltransferase